MHHTPTLGAFEAGGLCFLYLGYLFVIVLLSPIETNLPLSDNTENSKISEEKEEEETSAIVTFIIG